MKPDYYVYVYIDPRNFEEFYYGKGCGSRKDAHLFEESDSAKSRRIQEIKKAGLTPSVFFAYLKRYGFVGLGRITQKAAMARDLLIDGKPLLSFPLSAPLMSANSTDRERSEYVALWIGLGLSPELKRKSVLLQGCSLQLTSALHWTDSRTR